MASEPEPVAWEQITKNIHTMLIRLQVGGCTCDTKSPTLDFHDVRCVYRQAAEVAGVLDTLSDQIEAALLAAEQRGRDAERALLDWMAKDICLELSWGQLDPQDEGGECGWMVHRRWGNINDTEWHLIGTGDTPAEAIAAAIRKGDTPNGQ